MHIMFGNKWYRALFWTLTIFLVIWVGTQISFVFEPVKVILALVTVPLIIAGLFFYFLVGIVDYLERRSGKRGVSVAITLTSLLLIITIVFSVLGPLLVEQVTSLVNALPSIAKELQVQIFAVRDSLMENEFLSRFVNENDDMFTEFTNNVTAYLGDIFGNVASSVGRLVGFITSAVITIVVIPFMLIYMLLDGKRLPDSIVKWLPKSYETETRKILNDMHTTVKNYVHAQLLVAFFVGITSLIGLWIVGVDYAILLALFMMVTNIIPYVGPFLGAAPAVVVAFIQEPIMAVWVIIVIIVVQQIESNVISPLIQGKSLKVHPLTIIIVLLVAGNLAGIIGMLIAVPTYAVAKVVVQNIVRIYKLREHKQYLEAEEEKSESAIITDPSGLK
ncbi:MAG: AI-2E family transporter [Exiguobacterium sp.]|uniref:AI-2E family transporter n=2 Tax=Exiguobacterium alkaliphilum TaxID=1428684 RepID=A0ABT2L1J1_9BACL|nr:MULTISPECIES: AI-2E family transporter [Exiguobacterium]KDN57049.1 membrane protein [Exiguobacterium sp. AB2]MCT4796179.1 AI-2E family transporter [Exiguobacterium alkaliphilum]MDX5324106.1 AI-2E family transporter [Exiguobacterium sp.]